MVLLPIVEELEELKLHVVAAEEELTDKLRDSIRERDAAKRLAHEADLRWSKSASAIQRGPPIPPLSTHSPAHDCKTILSVCVCL
jgi:hypothetical protein